MGSNKKKLILVVVGLIAMLAILAAVVVPVTLAVRKNNNNNVEKKSPEETSAAATTSSSSSFTTTAGGSQPAGSTTTTTTTTTTSTARPFPSSTNQPVVLRPTASPTINNVPTQNNNTNNNNATVIRPTKMPIAATIPTTTPAAEEPELGSAAGTPYLHCTAAANVPATHHIVLLHGASFTKEIWVKLGILDQFCAQPHLAVTALDMSFGRYSELQAILSELAVKVASSSSTTSRPPAVVLVTPSAGGSSVVDWLINGDVTQLKQQVSVWVPVSVVSVPLASDEQIKAIVPMAILAIYGDQDTGGGRTSQRLATLAGATVVELTGGHPVYRDSPDEFVTTILNFL